ncbi:MAG TPA: tetratricopeptide repeat protein [Burkholderiales bacterium]|nr:tetratricopeptide repeat protein [Burkholderiales bacterium]
MSGFRAAWVTGAITLLCAALGPAPAHAAGEADAAFEAGIGASRAGDDIEALKQFQRAQAAGLDRAALYYNLGVTHYRLGNYPAARNSFQRLTRHETLAALAHYNLALVALRLNEKDEAHRQFLIAHRLTEDPKLRYLARQQVGQLAPDTQEGKRWSATVSAGAGYDDNLVVQDTGGAASTGDQFFELFLGGTGTVHGTRRDGVNLYGSAYLVEYLDNDAFSMSFLRGGAARAKELGGWAAEAGGELELSTLGDRDYLRTLSARVSGKRAIAAGATLELRYRFSDVRARDSIFSYLDGYQHRFSVEGYRAQPNGWLRGRGSFEMNDRDDLREGSVFTSFSPTRAGIRAEYGRNIDANWEISASLGLVASRYRDANVLADASRVRRSDDQLQIGLNVARTLDRRWQIGADYQYYDNDSNLGAYEYSRSIYTLRLVGVF